MAPAGPPQLRLSADLKLRSQGSLATALSPSPSTQTHEQTKPHAPGRVGLVRTHRCVHTSAYDAAAEGRPAGQAQVPGRVCTCMCTRVYVCVHVCARARASEVPAPARATGDAPAGQGGAPPMGRGHLPAGLPTAVEAAAASSRRRVPARAGRGRGCHGNRTGRDLPWPRRSPARGIPPGNVGGGHCSPQNKAARCFRSMGLPFLSPSCHFHGKRQAS